uniref:Endosomal/lysosomal proton channel TMEM175 n=1 Tax=Ciona intestinalis TaxID=7719 RepID=H2XWH6_CIOIN|nr:endosomal/lysosomal potassium channel TMEM175-like isoform X1 [Ciona intestinalis]|eukprot:XP_002122718.1 endosomal/lysosomal potassium channel TMEM175-like isoform X1 [Ciona intestinalis]
MTEGEQHAESSSREVTTLHADRIKLYSDALWASIATLMVAPILNSKYMHTLIHTHDEKKKEEIMLTFQTQTKIYFLTFLITCNTWAKHVWSFQLLQYVTDLSVFINMNILLFASILPYSYLILSIFHRGTSMPIIIYCILQLIISIFQIGIVIHSFRYPQLLQRNLRDKPDQEKKNIRNRVLGKLMFGPIILVIAIIVTYFSIDAALVCLAFIMASEWLQALLRRLFLLVPGLQNSTFVQKLSRTDVMFVERITMHRLEAFSDGVTAIAFTLIILDIMQEQQLTKTMVKDKFHNDLFLALASKWPFLVSYVAAFIFISMFWYTHMTLFKQFKECSRLNQLINNLHLSFVGSFPLCFKLGTAFKESNLMKLGVQLGSGAVFLGSSLLLLIYGLTLVRIKFEDDPTITWMNKDVCFGGKYMKILTAQLSILPITGCVSFIISFFTSALTAGICFASMAVVSLLAMMAVNITNYFLYEHNIQETTDHTENRPLLPAE